MRHSCLFIAIAGLALSTFLKTDTALAHEEVTVGPYVLEIGWLDEPALVGEKNAVFLSVVDTETNQPVEGLTTLTVSMSTGPASKDLPLRPLGEENPGHYAADVIPSVRGVYTVRLRGLIGNEAVDVTLDLDEVGEASSLQLPEPAPSTVALQQRLVALETGLAFTRAIAFIALAVGSVGLLAGIIGFVGRARQPKR